MEGRLPPGSGKPESRQFPLVFLMLEPFLLRASLLRSLELLSTASLGQWEAGMKSWGQMCLVYSHAYSVPLCAAKQKFCHLTLPSPPSHAQQGEAKSHETCLTVGRTGKGKLMRFFPTNSKEGVIRHVCILGWSFEQLSDLQTCSPVC